MIKLENNPCCAELFVKSTNGGYYKLNEIHFYDNGEIVFSTREYHDGYKKNEWRYTCRGYLLNDSENKGRGQEVEIENFDEVPLRVKFNLDKNEAFLFKPKRMEDKFKGEERKDLYLPLNRLISWGYYPESFVKERGYTDLIYDIYKLKLNSKDTPYHVLIKKDERMNEDRRNFVDTVRSFLDSKLGASYSDKGIKADYNIISNRENWEKILKLFDIEWRLHNG